MSGGKSRANYENLNSFLHDDLAEEYVLKCVEIIHMGFIDISLP